MCMLLASHASVDLKPESPLFCSFRRLSSAGILLGLLLHPVRSPLSCFQSNIPRAGLYSSSTSSGFRPSALESSPGEGKKGERAAYLANANSTHTHKGGGKRKEGWLYWVLQYIVRENAQFVRPSREREEEECCLRKQQQRRAPRHVRVAINKQRMQQIVRKTTQARVCERERELEGRKGRPRPVKSEQSVCPWKRIMDEKHRVRLEVCSTYGAREQNNRVFNIKIFLEFTPWPFSLPFIRRRHHWCQREASFPSLPFSLSLYFWIPS